MEVEEMTGLELVDELDTCMKCYRSESLFDSESRQDYWRRACDLREEIHRRTKGGYESIHALFGWVLKND